MGVDQSTFSLAALYGVENLAYTGVSDFTGTGNVYGNVLTGGAGADTLDGGGSPNGDTLSGGNGDDAYYVRSLSDVVIENGGEGFDTIIESLGSYALQSGVEKLVMTSLFNASGTGNALDNQIVGNAQANAIDGGAGADTLTGGAGQDTFVFQAGQANGDQILDFSGSVGQNDKLYFQGYGFAFQGASFTQVDATHWSINSADGLTHDTLTLANGASIVATDFSFR